MTSILTRTDCYKLSHMRLYDEGTEFVYSYLCFRSDREFKEAVFFGLQYYLKEYLSKPVTLEDVAAFIDVHESIVGPVPSDVKAKLNDLAELGYWPLRIKALPEGTVAPVKNCVMTIENTLPGFHWAVGFVESFLLKVWYPTTVATRVLGYRRLVNEMTAKTDDDNNHWIRDFMVHDFGYRSDTSEESAAISGAAHLIHFTGSDTIPALSFVRKYYGVKQGENVMASVPASEHSVMCSYGKTREFESYERILDLYPTGIVSVVSDTYDIWHVCTNYLPRLKERILARDGKVVIRPDSGVPENIICGDPNADVNSPAHKGVLRLLDEEFGHTVNDKGYKVLNNKIGLIYGDGMYYDRYKRTLERMESMGYAASNLIVGIGGILRAGTRDTLGAALKATHVINDGQSREIFKSPVTGIDKKSHRGLMCVTKDETGTIITCDQIDREQEENNTMLVPVFENGQILKEYTLAEVRKNVFA